MKTITAFLTLALTAAVAHAGIFCGANSETKTGSHQYDKNIFSELNMDTSKDLVVFVKPDGRVLKSSDGSVTPAAIGDGDLAIYVTFLKSSSGLQLTTARVKTDPVKTFEMVDVAMVVSKSDRNLTLLANGIAINCIEN